VTPRSYTSDTTSRQRYPSRASWFLLVPVFDNLRWLGWLILFVTITMRSCFVICVFLLVDSTKAQRRRLPSVEGGTEVSEGEPPTWWTQKSPWFSLNRKPDPTYSDPQKVAWEHPLLEKFNVAGRADGIMFNRCVIYVGKVPYIERMTM
jgi:hypothetical protein